MNADSSSSFGSLWPFLVNCFKAVIQWTDGIIIFNRFSLLDFNIAILIFGVSIAVVLNVVHNFAFQSESTVHSSREEARRDKKNEDRYQRRRAENEERYQRRREEMRSRRRR